MSFVTPDEKEQILAALMAGESIHSIAARMGRSKGTIHNYAKASGFERSTEQTAAAAQARLDYNQAARLELLNKAFAKAEEILENSVERAGALSQWAIAFGILTDKRRLEDGEATSRAEVANVDDARERLASRLDELASRRAARDTAERAI